MWANNEVGTVQPIAELAAVAAARGVPVHTDAVQAVGPVPVDFAACGVDALTITGHKVGGPVGVGALLLGREVECTPLLHGGGQERDVRSGTLDVPGDRRPSRSPSRPRSRRQQEHAARIGRAARRADRAASAQPCPEAVLNGDPDATGCPATRTSRSPAARATRC